MKSLATPPPAINRDQQQALVNQWNARFIYSGTAIRVTPEIGKPYVSTTRGRAFLSPEGLALIKVAGEDFRPLSQIQPV